MGKICEVCSAPIKGEKYWQKFCSGACRTAKWGMKKYIDRLCPNCIKKLKIENDKPQITD